MKQHWDSFLTFIGLTLTWLASHGSFVVAVLIGLSTLVFVAARAFIWVLKARIAWRNRDNTAFFFKSKDDKED